MDALGIFGIVLTFKEFVVSLLTASSVRFPLISEGAAEQHVFKQFPLLSKPLKLTLRSYEIPIRLALEGEQFREIFITIPNPAKLTLANN